MLSPSEKLELGEALNSLAERYGLSGHVLLYLDGGKVKIVGEMSLTALAPYLMKIIADKMGKGT